MYTLPCEFSAVVWRLAFSAVLFRAFCSAYEVTCVVIEHFNRFSYLLTTISVRSVTVTAYCNWGTHRLRWRSAERRHTVDSRWHTAASPHTATRSQNNHALHLQHPLRPVTHAQLFLKQCYIIFCCVSHFQMLYSSCSLSAKYLEYQSHDKVSRNA